MPIPKDLDEDVIAEVSLAILSLSREGGESGYRAWKGLDWDVMHLLHEKGWIGSPVGKQKSVALTEEGIRKADKYLDKYFRRK